MITAFGKQLRNIRMDCGEILKNMADKLGVTSSFLSAVEVGKKNIPEGWVEKISILYNLKSTDISNLKQAAQDSITMIKVDLKNIGGAQRDVALVFARAFDSITDETASKIISLMNKNDSGKDE